MAEQGFEFVTIEDCYTPMEEWRCVRSRTNYSLNELVTV